MSSKYANSIATALENPTMVKTLYVNLSLEQERDLLPRLSEISNLSKLTFSNGAEFEFPKEIFKLKKLKELYFSNLQLESLPDEFGTLSNLESLTFYTVPLKTLPESISGLSALKRIIIEGAKIEQLPETFGLLKNLELVSITNSTLKVLPDNIGGLKKLKELKLGNNKLKQLPTSSADLQCLERLELYNNCFEEFPQALCSLKKLQIIYLANNSLTALPDGIGGIQGLTFLDISNNCFKNFPEQIYKLSNLKDLYLSHNQISNLPDSLGLNAKSIDTLSLSENAFEHFPYILFDWYKLRKPQRWRLSIDRKYYNNTEIFDLLESKSFQDSERQSQIDFFHIFIGDKAAMSKIPLPRLWEALNTVVPKIAAMTLAFMTEPMKTPLQKGDKVFIAGKLTQDVEALKTRLQEYEIELLSKLEADTNHVLVTARSNKKIFKIWPENVHWQWITEAQLMQFFDVVNPSYLVESADTDAQKVSDLIMTLDEDNMALAMSLVEGGGLPESLFTELFIVYKFSTQEELCKKALELLKQKANPELQNVLKNRSKIYKKSYFREPDKRALEEHLVLFTNDSGLDIGKLAYIFYKKAHCCLPEVLNYAPSALKISVLQKMIGEYNRFTTFYPIRLVYFPMELFAFPELKSISINTSKERKVKGAWVENTDFIIPEDIYRFEQLEEFQISGMFFNSLPLESFAKMKKLKRIFVNVSADFDQEAAKAMLPHCEIFFR